MEGLRLSDDMGNKWHLGLDSPRQLEKVVHQAVRRWRAARVAWAAFEEEFVRWIPTPAGVSVLMLRTDVVPLLHLIGNTISAKGAAVRAAGEEWQYAHAIMLRSAAVGGQWTQCRLRTMLQKG